VRGPRKVSLGATDAPATLWNPVVGGHTGGGHPRSLCSVDSEFGAVPSSDDAIAFARVTQLSRWNRNEGADV
jgi:hypothetical protein